MGQVRNPFGILRGQKDMKSYGYSTKQKVSTNRQLMRKAPPTINRRFSVAPMLDWTDTHCRYLMRLISKNALLYTEMVTTGAILHGDRNRHLDFNKEEHPLALQLGGSEPKDLAACTKVAAQWHYDEVNLNCGCPSDRVQSGRFGACLMKEPALVADCLKAMADASEIPVTLKCRIGVDDMESYEEFRDFIGEVHKGSGCNTVIVHARKAWLKGLSPKENREIPPLHYDYVYRLKQDLPHLEIILNGGINTLEEAGKHLEQVDGVMMGRQAYQNPYIMHDVDRLFYDMGESPHYSRKEISQQFVEYAERCVNNGAQIHHLTRHILGLFHEVPGAKKFRRHISENIHKPGASVEVLKQAIDCVA